MAGEPLPVYGDGKNIRDWLYVEDHAKALTLVLEHGVVGETYNVGGRNERTNLHVVESICDLLDEVAPRAKGARRDLITFVRRSPRPRSPLRHRRVKTRARTRLAGRGKILRAASRRQCVGMSTSNLGGGRSWSEGYAAKTRGTEPVT